MCLSQLVATFFCLHPAFANSLNPDQTSDLDPNCLTLMVFLNVKKLVLKNKNQQMTKTCKYMQRVSSFFQK